MSHWRPKSGSLLSVAGTSTVALSLPVSSSGERRMPLLAVDATSAIRVSAFMLDRNVALSDRATATPMASYEATSWPPAALTLDDASAGTARLLYRRR